MSTFSPESLELNVPLQVFRSLNSFQTPGTSTNLFIRIAVSLGLYCLPWPSSVPFWGSPMHPSSMCSSIVDKTTYRRSISPYYGSRCILVPFRRTNSNPLHSRGGGGQGWPNKLETMDHPHHSHFIVRINVFLSVFHKLKPPQVLDIHLPRALRLRLAYRRLLSGVAISASITD